MLNTQQPFGADVITRISATMMDPDALGTLRDRAHETLATLTDRGLRRGGRRSVGGLRDRRRRQRDDAAARARDRSRAALDGAVHDRRAHAARRRRRPTSASTCTSARPPCSFPALGAYVGPDIVAGHPRDRADARQAHAALHRRRHELGDRPRLVGATRSRRRRLPARRSRRRRSAAACAPPTARSRA